MEELKIWEMLAIGGLAALVIFVFRPNWRETMRQTREAKRSDWMGALLPLGAVILFVFLLIAMVRG